MDVVALYPSIPIQEGIDCVVRFIQQHFGHIDMLGLSVDNINDLLTFVLNNYLRFGDDVYRQEGVAMGNQLAPPLAIIFMHCLEEKCSKQPVKSLLCTPDTSMTQSLSGATDQQP